MGKDKTAPANPGPASSQGASRGSQPDGHLEKLLESKLAPIDEYRGRSESWMKEITSQVARLATSAEADQGRAGKIDNRIADLESRIQSLLTLTELVSLDKNPFAEQGPPGPSQHTPPVQAAAPAPATAPIPAAKAAPASAPNEPHVDTASLDAASPFAMANDTAHSGSLDNEVAPHEKGAMGPTSGTAPPAADPIAHALSPANRANIRGPPTPAMPSRPAMHPNNAQAEPLPTKSTPGTAGEPGDPADPAPGGPPREAFADGPPHNGNRNGHGPLNAGDETRRRLMVLQWAELLAGALPKLELGSFLGFYVESGWVDRTLAACVRNLAWQLHHASAADHEGSTHTLPELHARSILILSHLGADPVPHENARQMVREARAVVSDVAMYATP